ncbi:MAG TPA: CPBP family intramembrane glutamic endopeptidase [Gemmatimonadales bacterium]|nr:CPBP family intramembrane glutamic endopeptidase [Gemmatimonadales bacterium]
MAGEAGLLLLAWALGRWLGINPGHRVHLTLGALGLGALAAVPLLLGLRWIVTTRLGSIRHLVGLVTDELGPVLVSRSIAELVLIASLAGVAEETLFRGVVQVGLTRVFPDGVALALASAAFGLAHFVTPAYALLAAAAGLYLGALYMQHGNLLVPVVAHSLYDLVALLYLIRRYRASQALPAPSMNREG